MYQAIHTEPYSKFGNNVFLRDDKLGWKSFRYDPTYYRLDKNGKFNTLDGKKVNPVERKQYNHKDPNSVFEFYEIDIPWDTRVLVEAYMDEDEAPEYQNILFFDIETEILDELNFWSIKKAPKKITSIAFYNYNEDIYYCYILDENNTLSDKIQDNKIIKSFNNEQKLLNAFLYKFREIDPTIISGWNSYFFDIPYLYHRIKNVLGEDEAVKLSPINIVKEQFREDAELKIAGVNHLDYMLLFKKYITKQEPSYALDKIGTKYVKLGKIDYEGNLDDLFLKDVDKFIDYNIRDVEILKYLDDKMKFILLTINICHLCHVPYGNIFQSTLLNEGAILTYLKRQNIVSPNKPTTYKPELKELNVKRAEARYSNGEISAEERDRIKNIAEYAGGYLMEPKPGLYEWVSDLDFTSLYPSIIRNLNIGIETLLFRIKNRHKYDNQLGLADIKQYPPDTILTLEKVNDKYDIITTEIRCDELIELIEDENLIISANGTVYRSDINSVVVDILNDWFNKRKYYKGLMKEAYKSGDKEKGEYYNRLQFTYKIKLNDVYGVFAISSFRYTDGNFFISKSITLTGQRLTVESIDFVNKEINRELGNI